MTLRSSDLQSDRLTWTAFTILAMFYLFSFFTCIPFFPAFLFHLPFFTYLGFLAAPWFLRCPKSSEEQFDRNSHWWWLNQFCQFQNIESAHNIISSQKKKFFSRGMVALLAARFSPSTGFPISVKQTFHSSSKINSAKLHLSKMTFLEHSLGLKLGLDPPSDPEDAEVPIWFLQSFDEKKSNRRIVR